MVQKLYYDIVVPGSEIPKWFNHQSQWALTGVERTILSDEKIIGVVVCCVFVFHELPPIYDDPMSFRLYSRNHDDPMLLRHPNPIRNCYFPAGYVRKTTDDSLGRAHLWLHVIPAKFRFLDKNQLIFDFSNGFWGRNCSFDKNQLIFYFTNRCPGVEVKKFGIRFIHEDEVEELNQTINQCSSSTFQNFNQDLDKSIPDGAKIEKLSDELIERRDRHIINFGGGMYRSRRFSISIKNLGAVWEDL